MGNQCETSGQHESCCSGESQGSCGCSSGGCNCSSGGCGCSSQSCGCPTENCGCSSGCGGDQDPMEKALGKWVGAFFEALTEVKVGILKTKIQKAWGGAMEKEADAVIEAMEAIWKSTMTKAQAHTKLKERFHQIYSEAYK